MHVMQDALFNALPWMVVSKDDGISLACDSRLHCFGAIHRVSSDDDFEEDHFTIMNRIMSDMFQPRVGQRLVQIRCDTLATKNIKKSHPKSYKKKAVMATWSDSGKSQNNEEEEVGNLCHMALDDPMDESIEIKCTTKRPTMP
ncbi:Uncharacterized protein TCM_013584 [Theobroma cacao]|uniref:Uncharacterized protein n=1 Tax=Theobroma cacao TaxID=3641 RepID=A0A061G3M7_THECC|nr:Uncharacterized protein TCM_013584 [Theobroma cacao]